MISSKFIFPILFTVLVQNALAFGDSNSGKKFKSWASFTCFLEAPNFESATLSSDENELEKQEHINPELDHSKFITVVIGEPEEGWPLVDLLVNGEEVTERVRQFQFELRPQEEGLEVKSHMVWITKVDPQLIDGEKDFNRILSVAKIETIVSVSKGVKTTSYAISQLNTNVDAQNTSSTREILKYKCAEPEIF